MVIKAGVEMQCYGSGMVMIIDGNDILQTNVVDADDDTPIFVENLKVHLLCKDTRFSMKDRKVMAGKRVAEAK